MSNKYKISFSIELHIKNIVFVIKENPHSNLRAETIVIPCDKTDHYRLLVNFRSNIRIPTAVRRQYCGSTAAVLRQYRGSTAAVRRQYRGSTAAVPRQYGGSIETTLISEF